ncbi:major capsid protein [Caudoviricetes sp.]|nr:major capsid protein [Caudoviricetes sp.]
MTTAGYPDLVTDLDIKFQGEMQVQMPDMVTKFYSLEPWTNGDPKKMTFQTYDLPAFGRRTGETQAAAKYSPVMGNQMEKEFFKYAMSTDWTLEMEKFDSQAMRERMAKSFASALTRNKEIELTHQILTYADTSNYQPMDQVSTVDFNTPDALPVGSASHTVPGRSGETFSNILANADPLSTDSLTSLIRQLEKNTRNDYGTVVPVKYNMLVIPDTHEMRKRAFEITGSDQIPYEHSNTVNFYGKGNIGGHALTIAALNYGALDRNGEPADGQGGRDNRQYYWGVFAEELLGANKYATGPGAGVEKVQSTLPNAMYGLMAYQFNCFAVTRWQGKGYSFATSL